MKLRTRIRPVLLALILIQIMSCGLTDPIHSESEGHSVDYSKIYLQAVSGDDQIAFVGDELQNPVVVRVVDEEGRSQADINIEFEVLTGDAAVNYPSQTTTDDKGTGNARVLLGITPGDVTIVAKIVTDEFSADQHEVLFSASGRPVSASKLYISDLATNGQIGTVTRTLARPLSVIALDERGDPVPDQMVSFQVIQGSPEVSVANEVTTDLDGTAGTSVSLGTHAEEILIKASWLPDDGSDPNRSVVFIAIAEPDAIHHFQFISGQTGCAGENTNFSSPVVVRLLDAHGNRVPGYTIEADPNDTKLRVTGATSYGDPVTLVTDSNGEARISLKAGSVSGTGYDNRPRLTVRASAPGEGINISKYTDLRITKNKWLLRDSSTPQRQYSNLPIDPTNPLEVYGQFDFKIRTKGKCDESLSNQSVNFEIQQARGACSSWPGAPWFAPISLGSVRSSSTGIVSASHIATVFSLRPPAPGPVGNRYSMTASGFPNSITFYGDSTGCE